MFKLTRALFHRFNNIVKHCLPSEENANEEIIDEPTSLGALCNIQRESLEVLRIVIESKKLVKYVLQMSDVLFVTTNLINFESEKLSLNLL
jgi:hypothetical protein